MGLQGQTLAPPASGVETHIQSYGTVVLTIAAMRALGPTDRPANQWRALDAQDAFYEFEEASVSADDGDLVLKPDDLGGGDPGRWEKRTGGGMAPVTSVFGRTGAVVAVAGDYDSTEVDNVSGVVGATITAALNTLNAGKLNLAGGTMTGTLTTQVVQPDGDGTRSVGTDAAAYLTFIGRNLHADIGQTFTLRSADAVNSIIIFPTGGIRFDQDMTFDATGTRSFGSGSSALLNTFTRNVQPDTGQSFLLNDEGGQVRIQIDEADGSRLKFFDPSGNHVAHTIQTKKFVFLDGVQVMLGTGQDAAFSFDTTQLNDHLILGVDSVTNIFLITDQDRIGTLDYGIGTQSNPTLIFADGSLTAPNIASIHTTGGSFIFNNRASGGKIRFQSESVNILIVDPPNVTITQIAGAEPISNVTGLDSRKLGFEARLWDGAAPQTRTGFIRFEDVSGEDDQGRITFSSDDNGGVEVDFLEFRRDTDAFIRPSSGSALILEDSDGVDTITIASGGNTTISGTGIVIFSPAGELVRIAGDIIPEADGTRSVGVSTAVYGTGWFRTLRPDSGQNLIILDPEGDEAIRVQSTVVTFNDSGQNRNLRVKGDNDTDLLFIDGGLDRVGVGVPTAGHLGKFHVDQFSTTAAIPVVYLDQADLSEEFIEFAATIGVGNPIEAVAAKTMTPTHFLRVSVAGVGFLYLDAGTIA